MSLLSTVETLLSVMEESPEIVRQLERIVLNLVALILNKNIMEFYEEALSLIYNLTSTHISPDLWQCYDMLHHLLSTDGFDYFMEMLPELHNFVTVDTAAFLSVDSRLPALCQMCQSILTKGEDEDCECHAAKLLEVVILQCSPPAVVLRDIASLVLHRMLDSTRSVQTTELRSMLLQVVIAGLYSNCEVLLTILDTTPLPNTNVPVAEHFVKQWIEDVDCFLGLHDRKLCVLGLCTLLQLGPTRVPALSQCYSKILPALLVLFQGLKRAYAAKAAEENNDDDDDDDDEDPSDLENEVLDSDEDELNENDSYLENLKDHIDNNAAEFGISTSIQVRLHCPRRNSTVHI
ncbi:Armadillo-type fold [Trinorchestia longiramus]|nr:Armadillo-type fold [Trinorchestia longiramus]